MTGRPLRLGIDSGGSKTHAVLAGDDGRILGLGTADASNYQYVGEERATGEINAAIGQAFAAAGLERRAVDAACFGFGGADTPQEMSRMEQWVRRFGWARRYLVINDGLLPLYAACPDGQGVSVVAGTGAIMWAQRRDGRIARASGWGYLLGDEGSGYALGSEALRHIMRAFDGRGPATALTGRVWAHWRLDSVSSLVLRLYTQPVLPSDIAGLARIVLECAADGDAVAARIAQAGADELAQAAVAALRAADLEPPITLAYTGSLLIKSALYRDLFTRAVLEQIGQTTLKPVDVPAMGALAAAAMLHSGLFDRLKNEWHIAGTVSSESEISG